MSRTTRRPRKPPPPAQDGRIAQLSAILEDPILAGDVAGRDIRRRALAELIELRGLRLATIDLFEE
jgi:hypothetical protein